MVVLERSLKTRINSNDGTKLLERSEAWLLCQTSQKAKSGNDAQLAPKEIVHDLPVDPQFFTGEPQVFQPN